MRVAYVLDPLAGLNAKTDSSIELIRAHARAGDEVFVVMRDGVVLNQGEVLLQACPLVPTDDDASWYELQQLQTITATQVNLIVNRLEPPVNASYRIVCLLLAQAQRSGTPVVNDPIAVLAREEKLAALTHPELCPRTLIANDRDILLDFAHAFEGGCMVKPLDGMGGKGVFAFSKDDSNLKVTIELLLAAGHTVLVQERLAGIAHGDRRVFIIGGQTFPHMLNRVPSPGSHLGNMLAGGQPEAMPLGEAERCIGEVIGPELATAGIVLAGLDVIDGQLTEINVTCPTGLRTVRDQIGINVAEHVLTALAATVAKMNLAS